MAITFTELADTRQNLGFSSIEQINTATFGSSDYVEGGYLVNPSAFGFGLTYGMVVIGQTYTTWTSPASSYFWEYDTTTSKLQAFQGTGEAANQTNFFGLTLTILGKGF